MRRFLSIIILVILLFGSKLSAQEQVSFFAEDNLEISAFLYEINEDYPYIILFHQEGYSKGEYQEIAPKINMLNFNCLAVDLRVGEEINFINNQTSMRAKSQGYSVDYLDAEKDIRAAIHYVKKKSNKGIILFGSSFSASLCLKLAKDNPDIRAVIAFSPGEYFLPDITIKTLLDGFRKPVFVASSQREYPYMVDLFTYVPLSFKTIFKPEKGAGEHGAKALWDKFAESKEYWLALMIFLKKFI